MSEIIEVTAREILDRGSAEIDRRLPEPSLVRARLQRTMGEVYGHVYEFDTGPFNTTLVATRDESGAEAIRENLEGAPRVVRPLAEEIAAGIEPTDGSSPVLTDDRAPVECMTDLSILDYVRGG